MITINDTDYHWEYQDMDIALHAQDVTYVIPAGWVSMNQLAHDDLAYHMDEVGGVWSNWAKEDYLNDFMRNEEVVKKVCIDLFETRKEYTI